MRKKVSNISPLYLHCVYIDDTEDIVKIDDGNGWKRFRRSAVYFLLHPWCGYKSITLEDIRHHPIMTISNLLTK